MTEPSPKKIPLHFYRHASGGEPVRAWLKDLTEADRHTIGRDLMHAQWRWPVGMPLCRPLGQGLWEIRTHLPSDRIARVFVCQSDGTLVALHGFIKKTQKTPDAELALARRRQKELKK
jgi:phage-related protein